MKELLTPSQWETLAYLKQALRENNTVAARKHAHAMDWQAWENAIDPKLEWSTLEALSLLIPLRHHVGHDAGTGKQSAKSRFKRGIYNLCRWGCNVFKDPDLSDALLGWGEIYTPLARASVQLGMTDREGHTALHLACIEPMAPDPYHIKRCLDEGVDTNATNHKGQTALLLLWQHMDEYQGQYDDSHHNDFRYCLQASDLLTGAGASWTMADHEGCTPYDAMQLACQGDFFQAHDMRVWASQAAAQALEHGNARAPFQAPRRRF